jgi:hypothetical protein
LARLRHTGARLPAHRLRDLLAEIEGHLAESIPLQATDQDALEALQRLGPPGDIVEAEQPPVDVPVDRADRRGLREWAAVILLPFGGFAFGVGWLIGLILLWSSRLWTTREKLIGTLIVPGGLAGTLFVLLLADTSTTNTICSGRARPIEPATRASIVPGTMHCSTTGGPSAATTALQIALAVILIAAPIITAVYLAHRARTHALPLTTAIP